MPDMQFPRSYKRLHGAPYEPTAGPWPYIGIIAGLTIAALLITLT